MSSRALPPRIRQAIAETENRNEIVISLVQAFLVSFLALLYAISPKAFAGDVPFEPVPLVLALYAPIVIGRLVLAWRRALGPVLLCASIVADMAAILGLVWSFHLQYGQPAAFYLKAPTFAYVFIFIALRSLRYDPRYVLVAGGAAAGGWALLVLYALGPGDASITREFVRYVMGHDVLIGAEVDKMLSIAIVAGILGFGVARSRRLLALAAYESQARRELTRFFSPAVADQIVSSEHSILPGHGELREATALMMDLRGFTKMAASREPSAVMRLLADYQKRMVGPIFANGGTIDKFLGDGIMAHFGAAASSATAAADALRTVEALGRAGDAWRAESEQELAFGIGCAAGPVIFGAVGDEERLEYTVIGDPVNLAAKLEKHTKMAGVRALTTRATFERALAEGYVPAAPVRPLPAEAVDGVAERIDLVVLAENPEERTCRHVANAS